MSWWPSPRSSGPSGQTSGIGRTARPGRSRGASWPRYGRGSRGRHPDGRRSLEHQRLRRLRRSTVTLPRSRRLIPTPVAPLGTVSAVEQLVWHGVDGADRYRLTLYDSDGEVLWKATTPDTVVDLPNSVVMARFPVPVAARGPGGLGHVGGIPN